MSTAALATLAKLGSALIAIWTAFKGTDYYKANQKALKEWAIEAIGIGVATVMQKYVSVKKAESPNGKLTDEQIADANKQAKEIAIAYVAETKPAAKKFLTDKFVDGWIEKQLIELKGK